MIRRNEPSPVLTKLWRVPDLTNTRSFGPTGDTFPFKLGLSASVDEKQQLVSLRMHLVTDLASGRDRHYHHLLVLAGQDLAAEGLVVCAASRMSMGKPPFTGEWRPSARRHADC